jgi:hypothetical protein
VRLAALSAAVGAVLLIWAVIDAMGPESRHVVRANLSPPVAFVATVDGGRRVCQQDELLPAGSGALRLRVGTFGRPGPPLEVTLQAGNGAPPRRGRVAAGWVEGDVVIPYPVVRIDEGAARVCVRNDGTERVVVAGSPAGPDAARIAGGKRTQGRMWLSYLRPSARSWWSETGAVATRAGIARDALPGGWTLWLWLAATLVVIGGAVAIVLRAARR